MEKGDKRFNSPKSSKVKKVFTLLKKAVRLNFSSLHFNYSDAMVSPYTSLSPQYKRRVCGVWEERTSGVGSKDRMYESAIQLLKLRKWVVVSHYFCSCHNVVACRHRIHWYDRTC